MNDEGVPLLEVENSRWRRRSTMVCITVFLLGLVGLIGSILACYFLMVSSNAIRKSLFFYLLIVLYAPPPKKADCFV